MKFYRDLFIIFFILFIGFILTFKKQSNQELETIIDVSHDYSCDLIIWQKYLDLNKKELEDKINEICYKEQQNTTLPKS